MRLLKSGYRNSNPGPLAPQTSTLTSCAIARKCKSTISKNKNIDNISLMVLNKKNDFFLIKEFLWQKQKPFALPRIKNNPAF